ncbi:hypothetical protein ACFY05_23605 [Microtetraspora fusca]|uniref:Uncharacterized protein n=1 Tax=Microtetraspora fusca TaxID=1997 RepID=A0ABW6V938_MICFU
MDYIPHRVLVGLHQLGDHRDPVPAGRRQQHHRASEAHRTGAAPAHDLLQLLRPPNPERFTLLDAHRRDRLGSVLRGTDMRLDLTG